MVKYFCDYCGKESKKSTLKKGRISYYNNNNKLCQIEKVWELCCNCETLLRQSHLFNLEEEGIQD